jgi:hypothetical protein
MEESSEVAATATAATAAEELPSAHAASDEPAAGGHAVAVLDAARLSVELALAALAALAAAWVYMLTSELLMFGPGRGAWGTAPFLCRLRSSRGHHHAPRAQFDIPATP